MKLVCGAQVKQLVPTESNCSLLISEAFLKCFRLQWLLIYGTSCHILRVTLLLFLMADITLAGGQQ